MFLQQELFTVSCSYVYPCAVNKNPSALRTSGSCLNPSSPNAGGAGGWARRSPSQRCVAVREAGCGEEAAAPCSSAPRQPGRGRAAPRCRGERLWLRQASPPTSRARCRQLPQPCGAAASRGLSAGLDGPIGTSCTAAGRLCSGFS